MKPPAAVVQWNPFPPLFLSGRISWDQRTNSPSLLSLVWVSFVLRAYTSRVGTNMCGHVLTGHRPGGTAAERSHEHRREPARRGHFGYSQKNTTGTASQWITVLFGSTFDRLFIHRVYICTSVMTTHDVGCLVCKTTTNQG